MGEVYWIASRSGMKEVLLCGSGVPEANIAGIQCRKKGFECASIGQGNIGRNLKQRQQHKGAIQHVVMRHDKAFGIDLRFAKQHDVNVQRARPQRSALRTRPCSSSMR